MDAEVAPRAVLLVEGRSDQAALEALAARLGRDLRASGVRVVPMGGATNFRRYVAHYRAYGVPLAGLCDAGEEGALRRGLELAGLGTGLTRAGMAALGFHVCVADLEDELIRALGPDGVERVVGAQGELAALRMFQRQPAQRGRAVEAQLRRFFGTQSGRKVRYARLLAEALDLARVPGPLTGVLTAGGILP